MPDQFRQLDVLQLRQRYDAGFQARHIEQDVAVRAFLRGAERIPVVAPAPRHRCLLVPTDRLVEQIPGVGSEKPRPTRAAGRWQATGHIIPW